MADDGLFTDEKMVQTLTPYRKLRLLRGWSLEEAAERFHVTKKSLIQYELARTDPPKSLVRRMDEVYGCKGALIRYWLPRFSVAIKKPRSWWHSFKALINGVME